VKGLIKLTFDSLSLRVSAKQSQGLPRLRAVTLQRAGTSLRSSQWPLSFAVHYKWNYNCQRDFFWLCFIFPGIYFSHRNLDIENPIVFIFSTFSLTGIIA
jgi:hypothetical protein